MSGPTGKAATPVANRSDFLFVPYSPAWSLTIISVDVVVIGALCNYRWDLTRA